MKAEVKFEVRWWSEDNQEYDISISSCGLVDGDPIPMDLYIKILYAMSRLQKEHNESHEKPNIILPSAVEFRHPTQAKTTTKEGHIEGLDGNAVKRFIEGQSNTPPPHAPKAVVPKSSKKIKRYTVEEKTEIAMMYASGLPVAGIAEKFGRNANAIMVLVNKMGVKRGDNIVDPDPPSGDDAKPEKKKESVLKKPWYLRSQKPNNKDKVKYE